MPEEKALIESTIAEHETEMIELMKQKMCELPQKILNILNQRSELEQKKLEKLISTIHDLNEFLKKKEQVFAEEKIEFSSAPFQETLLPLKKLVDTVEKHLKELEDLTNKLQQLCKSIKVKEEKIMKP